MVPMEVIVIDALKLNLNIAINLLVKMLLKPTSHVKKVQVSTQIFFLNTERGYIGFTILSAVF